MAYKLTQSFQITMKNVQNITKTTGSFNPVLRKPFERPFINLIRFTPNRCQANGRVESKEDN